MAGRPEAARSLPDAGVRTAARARRPPRVPELLTELAQSSGGPAPWAQMGHSVRAIAVPGAVGLAAGHLAAARLALPVMNVVAGASALLSSIGTVWSSASLFLLIYAALGTGPIGALRPWWLTVLWFLAGVGWGLVLLVPGWLGFPQAMEQRRGAAVD